jgi:hypothetical protein
MNKFAIGLALLLCIVCFSAGAQAAPEGSGMGSSCPEMSYGFGHFVMVSAQSGVADQGTKIKKEKTCWVPGPSASGQNRVESYNGEDEFTSDYAYSIGPTGIDASARVEGKSSGERYVGGSGGAMLWLMWHDTLSFHSSKMPTVTPGDFYLGKKTDWNVAEGWIKVQVKLLQDPPQCTGTQDSNFKYATGVFAAVKDIMGGDAIKMPGPPPPLSTSQNWLLRMSTCGIPSGSITAEAPNGQSIAIHITVQENLLGNVQQGVTPSGKLNVDLSGIRLCVVKPSKPSDLTITSASGADYWCP